MVDVPVVASLLVLGEVQSTTMKQQIILHTDAGMGFLLRKYPIAQLFMALV